MWTIVEDTIIYAVRCIILIMQTFEKSMIHAVDILACKTLGKVEETLSVVTKTPEEVICYLIMYS